MKLLYNLIVTVIGKRGVAINIFLSLLAGFASFYFISLINQLISHIIANGNKAVSLSYVLQLVLAVLVFILAKRILSVRIVELSQTLFWKLRNQVLQQVLKTSYRQLVKKRSDIDIALNSDVNAMTSASYGIIDFFTSIVVAASTMVYLAAISIQLFLITIATAALGVFLYSKSQRKVNTRFAEAIALETEYMKKANALLDGFKEIFMDHGKGKDLFERDMNAVGEKAKSVNLQAQRSMMNGQAVVQVLFYLLIMFIMVMAAYIASLAAGEIVQFLFALIFLIGSISTIVGQLPGLARANASYKHIAQISKELEAASPVIDGQDENIPTEDFRMIDMQHIRFSYEQPEGGFGIGPFDFSVSRGEVVFIYGGNGSGKTTLINALMGVYACQEGDIFYNSKKVETGTLVQYRRNFAFVASDYYLFDELYGIETVNTENWNYYMQLFELNEVVTLQGRKLSTVDLSTGQRKRLALISALMEQKPLLVLDEWAADQDPLFRKKFYTNILPILKSRGFSIVAITHDDRYYHCADRLFRMDEGQLIQEDMEIFQNSLHHK